MASQPDFFDALRDTLVREMPECTDLAGVERLSGGASMETYRLTIRTQGGEQLLCMRRGAGGIARANVSAVALSNEALLLRTAKDHGVAEPEIYYELQPADGVGVGFVMEWLSGETLGSRIVRSAELETVRPLLADQCGRELAKIHAIDVEATGLSDHLPVLGPAEYLEQTWARYLDSDTAHKMIDFTRRSLEENLPQGSN